MSFEIMPNARAKMSPGSVYAISHRDLIYYAQIALDKTVCFFRFRTEKLARVEQVNSKDILLRISVSHKSITRAVRSGKWKYIGKTVLSSGLNECALTVQWSVGTINVSVIKSGDVVQETTAFDDSIQNLEVIMAYDAEHHVPERIEYDFDERKSVLYWVGTVIQQRRLKEFLALRNPDKPYHQLPENWVYLEN